MTDTKKLKRKRKQKKLKRVTHSSLPEEKKKKRIRKKYKKQKCAFVRTDNTKCKRNAVGKSTLCKQHGGNPTILDNLIQTVIDDNKALVVGASKFKPEYHPLAYIDFSRQGMSDVEIAAQFRIGITTIRSWSEKYVEFSTAYEIGNALHEAWWLTKGKQNLNDRTFNTNLFKFLTGNKLGYSEKIENKNLNMNVHGVLLVPSKVSEEEWAGNNADEDIKEAEIVND